MPPSASQIKVATEEIAKKIEANFKNTTWLADKIGGFIVTLPIGITAVEVQKWLSGGDSKKQK